jgi:hypothetical protein
MESSPVEDCCLDVDPLCSVNANAAEDQICVRTGTCASCRVDRQPDLPGQSAFMVSSGLASRRVMQVIVLVDESASAETTNATGLGHGRIGS